MAEGLFFLLHYTQKWVIWENTVLPDLIVINCTRIIQPSYAYVGQMWGRSCMISWFCHPDRIIYRSLSAAICTLADEDVDQILCPSYAHPMPPISGIRVAHTILYTIHTLQMWFAFCTYRTYHTKCKYVYLVYSANVIMYILHTAKNLILYTLHTL